MTPRILVCQPGPEYSVQDVHNGWVKGFRQLGLPVAEFNLNDRLAFYCYAHILNDNGEYQRAFSARDAVKLAIIGIEQACYEFWPDIVVLISGFFVDDRIIDLMRRHGHKVVTVHTESPYEDDRQIKRAGFADLNVINDPTNLDRFREVAPTVHLPHCYDPEVHKRRRADPSKGSDFCFAGTGYESRIEFFEKVDWTGLHATLLGNWQQVADDSPLLPLLEFDRIECCDNSDTASYYASAATSANLYRREANDPTLSEGWSIGPREVELAACGTWFARDPRPEGDELFPTLPTFTEPAELGDLIRWGVSHPDERKKAVRKAFAAVKDRTFDNNAAAVLSELGF